MKVNGLNRRFVKGQNGKVVEINGDERGNEKDLRPLCLVAPESPDLLDHKSPCGPGQKGKDAVQSTAFGLYQPNQGCLGFGKALEIKQTRRVSVDHYQEHCTAPGKGRMKQGYFDIAGERRPQTVVCPGAGQQRGGGRAHIVQVDQCSGKPLGVHKPFRLKEPECKIEKDKNGKAQENKDAAHPVGRQRDDRQHYQKSAQTGCDQAQRQQHQGDIRIKKRSGFVHQAVGEKNGEGINHHHPGAVHRAFNPAGKEDFFAGDRHGMDEMQIPAQIEFGQRGQYGAENQQGEKSDQDHREEFERQDITEILHTFEIFKDTIRNGEDAGPEDHPETAEQHQFQTTAPFVPSLPEGPPAGLN